MKKAIVVEQKEFPGDTSAVLCFIFTNLCFLFWANMMGFLGEAGGLAIGVVQIGVFTAYHIFSENLFQRGATFDGIVFGVFATFFGGVGGLNNIASTLCLHFGIPYSNVVINICWILCGIFCLGICPCSRHLPFTVFLVYFFTGIGMIGIASLGLGIIKNTILIKIFAWLEFVIGLFGLWICIATVSGHGGFELSLGKPLFQKENIENFPVESNT